MSRFTSFDGTRLSYEVEGSPDAFPILLIHGFAADSYVNWVRAGLSDKLRRIRRVVMLDQRGHGMSPHPHDVDFYAGDNLAKDAMALLDHLGIERCDIMGYSMGAGMTLRLVTEHPLRFRSAVLGGIGGGYAVQRGAQTPAPGAQTPPSADRSPRPNSIAEALLVADKSTVTNAIAKSFRDFADMIGADKKALAAFQMAPRRGGASAGLDTISIPVLVITAEGDPLATSPERLAGAIPGAKQAIVEGTHLNVVNNPAYHDAVLQFLASVG